MSKTVKVTYNADTLETTIIVDGKDFDTSRINGKEIADWAYPFMVRKVRWDGFYDEMVKVLGGEKAFDLIFEGSDEALAELKEAWEDAPVNVVSGEQENTVAIAYDADALTTEIIVNGQPFDTSRINGKDIEDWVYPFMMRKVKWDGIFDELKNVLGTDEYEIQFSGSRAAMKVLMENCPETVAISFIKSKVSKTETSEIVEKHETNDCDTCVSKEEELYKNGIALLEKKSIKKAIKCIRESAELGYSLAQYQLGLCYQSETGVKRNDAEMAKWFGKAAEQGLVFAQYELGNCYNNGKGVSENSKEARKLFKQAAEQGYAPAMITMGWLSTNVKDAEIWFKKGQQSAVDSETREEAEAGLAELRSDPSLWTQRQKETIGNKISQTSDITDDLLSNGDKYFEAEKYDEAVRCYRKAEKQGIIDAKAMLGLCYLCGLGVSQNDEYGAQLLEEAAEEGSGIAVELIEAYNESYDEAYGKSNNGAVKANINKLMTTANDFIKSDKGQKVLKKAGKGAAMGAVEGLSGGTPISVLGGAIKGAAGAAITAFVEDEKE